MTGRELYALSQSQGLEAIAQTGTRACAVSEGGEERTVWVWREPSTSESMMGRVFLVFKFFFVSSEHGRQTTI